MKAREKQILSTIRLIQADFKRIEVDERIEIDDARAIAIMDKMVKQRRDSAKQYRDADRPELASALLPAVLLRPPAPVRLHLGRAPTRAGREQQRAAARSMARALAPTISGAIYAASTASDVLHGFPFDHHLPFYVHCAAAMLGMLLSLRIPRRANP